MIAAGASPSVAHDVRVGDQRMQQLRQKLPGMDGREPAFCLAAPAAFALPR
jgi:hypothetical protein